MNEIDAIIEEIQVAARALEHRTSEHADRAALDLLLRLAWEVKQLQAHQHSYLGPPSQFSGRVYTTSPQRDTEAASHAAFVKQQADKQRRDA